MGNSLASIPFPNPYDRDTSGLHNDDVTWPFQFTRCSRQLDDDQVLQWEGYIPNQEARIATSGIHLMTILKHRIDSEQHLVTQHFALSSGARQYYFFQVILLLPDGIGMNLFSTVKAITKYRLVG